MQTVHKSFNALLSYYTFKKKRPASEPFLDQEESKSCNSYGSGRNSLELNKSIGSNTLSNIQ